ncbi:MAG: hypothetical protein JWO95_3337 [Verrucomicrobiales bacterium]|nr:hypothetical protein [Verrucomicrobiales bacterium]
MERVKLAEAQRGRRSRPRTERRSRNGGAQDAGALP